MKYRAEIDGLRAIAVVPVILFHAGFELFRGGFVGVDVFFVISGYLITSILIEDINNNRFNIVDFYERRARRILPALFLVAFLCIPFAWLWMLPSQMKDFSQSLVAVSIFASNVLFWFESGYFAAAAEQKPLLHTWSLAVEEQYYVLFPIFLTLAWRLGKGKVFWMIAMMTAISFLLSEWGWRNNVTANFYLSPTRAWELFAGSLAAFLIRNHGIKKSNPLSLIGLSAILLSIFFYDEATPFPSTYTLAPVLGTALVILYSDKETITAKLLSTKGCVGIGLISYSSYLWHQPLFAYARIHSIKHPSLTLMSALCVLTFFLAYVTWKYIESPFRLKKICYSKKSMLLFSTSGLVSLFSFGLYGHIANGIEFRLPEIVAAIESAGRPAMPTCSVEKFNNCLLGGGEILEKFVLVGDSHAGRYAHIFEKIASERNQKVRIIAGGWCAPLVNWSVANNDVAPNPDCFPIMEEEIYKLAKTKVGTVVLAAEWSNYTQGYRHGSKATKYIYTGNGNSMDQTLTQSFAEALTDTVTFLENHGKKVFIILPVPEYDFGVPNALAKVKMQGLHVSSLMLPISDYQTRNLEFYSILKNQSFANLKILNIQNFFCNEAHCIPYDKDHMPLYSDGNHLSSRGLRRVGGHLYDEIIGDVPL